MINIWLNNTRRMVGRSPSRVLMPMAFYLMLAMIFPLTLRLSAQPTPMLAPAMTWMLITLSCLQSHHHLFREDYRHGLVSQIYLGHRTLVQYAVAKILVFWLYDIAPLILITPLVGMMYQLPWVDTAWLMLSLFLGTPSMVMICSIPAALLQHAQQHTTLLSLLVFPLLIPELIFGAGTLHAWQQHHDPLEPALLLLGIFLICMGLVPVATGQALKLSLTTRARP